MDAYGIEPIDLVVVQPVSVQLEPGHRADRHRWAGDGPRRGEEPRARRCRRRSRRLSAGARRDPRRGRDHARRPGGASPATRSRTPPRTTRRSSRGSTIPRCRRTTPATSLPPTIHLSLELAQPLRYGENPHQQGARYRVRPAAELVGHDDAARRQGAELPQPVRHRGGVAARAALRRPGMRRSSSTPTRAAWRSADDITDAYVRANACDPVSAFGGIVALNRTVPAELADALAEVFTEVIVAPGVRRRRARTARREEEPARDLGRRRRRRCRYDMRPVDGGLLVQQPDAVEPRTVDVAGRHRASSRRTSSGATSSSPGRSVRR